MRIADCLWQDMAIASICHVTVTVCQCEGCIRLFVLVGGVDSCLHERGMAVATISLFVLYEDSCGGSDEYPCLAYL